jgi:hypothetical protein
MNKEKITKIVQTASPSQEDMQWLIVQYIEQKTGQKVEINIFKNIDTQHGMISNMILTRELKLLDLAYQVAAEYYGEKIREGTL